MNYVKISELPEISLQEISGSEDIILTKNTASKKLKLDTLYNYITNDINLEIETKVDKISGKGLSTEDFTTPEKSKLENIAENANNYSLPISSVSILGGIKKGDYLDISIDGIASISPEVPVKWGNIQSKPELYTKSETDDLFRNDSTNLNTPNLLVRRDSSGNFSASTITANLNGNANSANALGSPRTFAITGDVTGTVTSNLSNGFSINTSVQDDSHSHTISTLTGLQTLLDNKIEMDLIGSINGVASLDAGGKVPSIQLPSYVDDVLEFADLSSFPETGDIGKIYVDMDTNKTYRWSGTAYIYITSGAVDSVNGYAGVVNLSKSDIGLGTVDNTADIDKNVLSASKLTNPKTFSITGDISGSVSSDLSTGVSITSTLANSGISAGTYRSVSVNAKGIVTAGTNPTTIAGYSISDAYTKTEVQTVLPKVGFDTTNATAPSVGQMAWNIDESTLDIGLNGAVLQVGQEQLIKVRNNSGAIIPNGKAVMATGTIGNSGRITVALANLNQSNAKMILGVVTEDIAIGADGFCTTFGKIRQIQTDGANYGESWVDGDILYVKDSDAGSLTKVAPTETQLKMPIAIVIHAHGTNGTIFVRVNSIDENHAKAELALKVDKNENIIPGTNTKITYDAKGLVISGTSLLASDIPILNQSTTGSAATLTTGRTISMTGDVSWTSGSFNGSANVTGTSTLTTITDNGKGSFKKISTDSKGRVIGTTAVTQSDITTLLGSGSITNTMLVNAAVANLSGTNTGDQTNISGNAGTATKLQTARTINGVSFDGSANITITSDALISTSEYSTRNIRNSKRVFGIEVDLGALPNTTFKEVAFSFNAAYTYWIDGQNSYSTDGSEVITIPYNGYIGDGVSVKLDRTNNKIIIIADKDRTSFSSTKLVLNYTK